MAEIEQISNGESGSSVRTKLNLAIVEANKVSPDSVEISRTNGLITSVEINSVIHTINRSDGLVTGWENATFEWTIERDENGYIVAINKEAK